MKYYKCSLIAFGLLLGLAASSQQRTLKFEINQNTAMPTSNFRNLTSKTSFTGWDAAFMYGITDQVSVGVQTGFQDFYQKKERQVFHSSGSDLSAVVTNSLQLMPLLLKGKYKLTEAGVVQPFVALGVGGNIVQYTKYYGQFTNSKTGIHFMAQPEAGIHIPVGRSKRAGINLSAAYAYVPFTYNDADGLHHASVKAGISIPLR